MMNVDVNMDAALRRKVIAVRVLSTIIISLHPISDSVDMLQLLNSDKWIVRFLQYHEGDVQLATLDFLKLWISRKKMQFFHHVLPKNYKKIARIYGMDKDGSPLLVLNISELDILLSAEEEVVAQLLMMLLDDLDSKNVKDVAIVVYHGYKKRMDSMPKYFQYILAMCRIYRNFISKIYVFYDYTSSDCRERLRWYNISNIVKYVRQKNISEHFIYFDIQSYEEGNKTLDKSEQDDCSVKNLSKLNKRRKKRNKSKKNQQTCEDSKEKDTEVKGCTIKEIFSEDDGASCPIEEEKREYPVKSKEEICSNVPDGLQERTKLKDAYSKRGVEDILNKLQDIKLQVKDPMKDVEEQNFSVLP